MQPTNYPGHNKVYGKPGAWADEDCSALECVQTCGTLPSGMKVPEIYSRWQPSSGEIELMQKGHPVTLRLVYDVMVPAAIFVDPESPVADTIPVQGPFFIDELNSLIQRYGLPMIETANTEPYNLVASSIMNAKRAFDTIAALERVREESERAQSSANEMPGVTVTYEETAK